MAAIEAIELTKEYSAGVRPFNAVSGASLTVERGDFVSIMGKSGSGKSTLLNLIAGLLRPTSGTVRVNGRDVSAMSDGEASLVRSAEIGYVPQGQSLLGNISVAENVALPHILRGRGAGDPIPRAMDLLERVGIADLADRLPRRLSGGEQRRAAVARALMNSPSVVIADEPTSDLDSEASALVMDLLAEISGEGTAVLMATHDPDADRRGGRRLRMDGGRLSETG
ncbi:MAG: ABC transporter ATP-binding protein [Candidatus Methanoplasma sp.]|jgi:putative ABC transport system ATP-binding protein|nr:ABC transporter ATP-binding protein [Candidatus Methanoplasma sp.]